MRETLEISKRGIDLIVSFEGKHVLQADGRYKSYLDTLAKPPIWTCYCGLTKGITEDTILTEEEGKRLFARELAIYEDAITQLVKVPLNQNEWDSLVSWTYNCGPGALKNSTLLKVLNQGKRDQVPAQMMKWTHAGGKEYAGLVRRRKAEAALWLTPVEEKAAPVISVQAQPSEQAQTPVPPTMPQAVAPVQPSVTTVAANSKTVRYSGTGIVASAVAAWQWLFGVAKEAGSQAVSDQQSLSPFSALFKAVGANMEAIALIVIVGCLVGVIIERIAKERA